MAVHTVEPLSRIPQVVPFPSHQEQITQAQIERVIQLRNAVAAFKKHLDTAESEVKTALEAGAPVEPGTHVASLKESFRRNVAWRAVVERLAERLFGEGRGHAYAENVLQNTKPERSVKLVVS